MSDLYHSENNKNPLLPSGDAVPCGFVKYTCERQPRITYINRQMMDILRIREPEGGEPDYLEMAGDNIYLVIPVEERRRFSKYLNHVYASDSPIAGEITLLRSDGSRARVFGWVVKCVNEHGEEEFQTVCMDMTEHYERQREQETGQYLQALTEVYDKVFEFNLDTNMVRCLYCEEGSSFKRMEGLSVSSRDMLRSWILSSVPEEEQEPVRWFFDAFLRRELEQTDGRPPQITYHSRSSSGEIRQYTGIFLRVDDARSLYCCRVQQDLEQAEALRTENARLKEGIRDLAMQFSDGIAGFELSPEGGVKPLYVSENAYEFFGRTREQWLSMAERFTPLADFVAHTDIPYEEFAEGVRSGEAEFPYYDVKSGVERRIRVICSPRRQTDNVPRFAMLYDVGNVDAQGQQAPSAGQNVFIRTFGYFDVFVGGRPIAFRNKKAKELLALLVDRRGGYVTSDEAIGFLWEDEPTNSMTLSRYRKVALRLKNTLEEYGIPEIVESVDGKRRIVTERVKCDLFQYLSGQEEYAQLFKGSYLTNYSWGETTLGELVGDQI